MSSASDGAGDVKGRTVTHGTHGPRSAAGQVPGALLSGTSAEEISGVQGKRTPQHAWQACLAQSRRRHYPGGGATMASHCALAPAPPALATTLFKHLIGEYLTCDFPNTSAPQCPQLSTLLRKPRVTCGRAQEHAVTSSRRPSAHPENLFVSTVDHPPPSPCSSAVSAKKTPSRPRHLRPESNGLVGQAGLVGLGTSAPEVDTPTSPQHGRDSGCVSRVHHHMPSCRETSLVSRAPIGFLGAQTVDWAASSRVS